MVIEVVDWNNLFFDKRKGEYMVFKIVKKNIDTLRAAEYLSKDLDIPLSNIIYLGLKDKNSTSIQYFFVKKAVLRKRILVGEKILDDEHISITPIGYVKKKPTRKVLMGNVFRVTIDGSLNEYDKARSIMHEISEKGLPSYYGYQRFGVTRPNTHLIGKYLLLNLYNEAAHEFLEGAYLSEPVKLLLMRSSKRFSGSLGYEKKIYSLALKTGFYNSWQNFYTDLYKLFIESYQSYLFNRIVTLLFKHNININYDMRVCVPGANCLYPQNIVDKVLLSEGIDTKIFIKRSVKGWLRKILFKPKYTCLKRGNKGFSLSFYLDKGFYASIVLRELFKENLILTK